ncbi:MAG: hypothetical protein JSU88_09915 [Nitrospinaceae bacterium]|nr:MAG: hypothetical protein JSU88_09915 [Nitrospinaceae bacterium]
MKLFSVMASVLFITLTFLAPAGLLAHEGPHGAEDGEQGKFEEGSGSSVIDDPHGNKPGHEYDEGQYEEEEGSFSRHYKKYRNKKSEGSSGLGRPEETMPPKADEGSGSR